MNLDHEEPKAFSLLSIDQLPETNPGWLIEGVIGEGGATVLGGPPKHLKSWLTLELAVSVASGQPFLGEYQVTRPGPVLVYDAENHKGHVRRRLEGICSARGVDPSTLPIRIIDERLMLDDPTHIPKLERTITELKPVLLILDPLVRLHRGNENNSQAMSAVLGELSALKLKHLLAMVLVHHTRKRNGGKQAPTGAELRGSSELYAWYDSGLIVARGQHGDVHTMALEHRAAPGGALHFRLTGNEESQYLELAAEEETGTGAPPVRAVDLKKGIIQLVAERGSANLDELQAALKKKRVTLSEAVRELVEDGVLERGPGRRLRVPGAAGGAGGHQLN